MVDIQFNKEQFVIIGAGGLGRELWSWFQQSSEAKNKYSFIGFIDDDLSKLEGFNIGAQIIGTLKDCDYLKYPKAIIAINNAEIKREIFKKTSDSGTEIIGFKHENCLVGEGSKIDKSTSIFPFVGISCNTHIGKGVFINNGSQIGHDVTIGDFTSIMANVDVGGNCQISSDVFIGTGATLLPGIKVSSSIKIAAGSVVFRSLKRPGTYLGNPAKRVFND